MTFYPFSMLFPALCHFLQLWKITPFFYKNFFFGWGELLPSPCGRPCGVCCWGMTMVCFLLTIWITPIYWKYILVIVRALPLSSVNSLSIFSLSSLLSISLFSSLFFFYLIPSHLLPPTSSTSPLLHSSLFFSPNKFPSLFYLFWWTPLNIWRPKKAHVCSFLFFFSFCFLLHTCPFPPSFFFKEGVGT